MAFGKQVGLQVNMLSEQELTTILQMLQKLCQHMGVKCGILQARGSIIFQKIHKLASELENRFPEE